jgi:methionine sulfoxide reductase heme-binding subunit
MNNLLKKSIKKHVVVGMLSFIVITAFFLSRPEIGWNARIWKAMGDGAFILLAITLMIGPMAKLWPLKFARMISWRRETGIWAALIALAHAFLIQLLLFQGDMMRLLGYSFINNDYVLVDPGLGLSNIIGIVALFMMALLLATSSNYAINMMGNKAWKFLHMSAYTIFYLVAIHASYHLVLKGSLDWFSVPFMVITATVIMLQGAAFVKVARMDRRA